MWALLRKQYTEKNSRPKTFVEIAAWEKTRLMVVEHEVMEQIGFCSAEDKGKAALGIGCG